MHGGDDPDTVAARLTWIFADQRAGATFQQRQSVRRWQGRDRFYRLVQLAVIEDPGASDEARDVADDLTMLAAPLTQGVRVWRGIRSIEATFEFRPTIYPRWWASRLTWTASFPRQLIDVSLSLSSTVPAPTPDCTKLQFKAVPTLFGCRQSEIPKRRTRVNYFCFQAWKRVSSRWTRRGQCRS